MSDTGEVDLPEERRGPQIAIGVAAAVVVFLLLLVALLLFDETDEGEVADAGATPTPPATPVSPSPTPTPTPTPSPSPTPTPSPEADEPTERDPTDADAAAFAAEFTPPDADDVHSVTVDLDGDGLPEIVFVSLAEADGGVSRVDVARWAATRFEIEFTDRGGAADEIDDFTVVDLTGDGRREIVVSQRRDDGGESVSLWGVDDDGELDRQRADGGCWDGSHTYGAIGVQVASGEIRATCDDAPLPQDAWSTDVYVWQDGRWAHETTAGP